VGIGTTNAEEFDRMGACAMTFYDESGPIEPRRKDPGAGGPCENTDRHLWPQVSDPGAETESIHVTAQGGIGINVGGYVYVKPLREWHKLAGGKEAMLPVAALSAETNLAPINAELLKAALETLSEAFVAGTQGSFGMRIPAEPYRDGDIVCGSAVRLIARLQNVLKQKSEQIERLQLTIQNFQTQSTERLATPPPASRSDDLNTAIRFLEEIREGAEDEWPALNEFLERISEKQPFETPAPRKVSHKVTCKLFPDPFDEREPVGPCDCGAAVSETEQRS
jgi:hypothetical protein